MLHVHRSIPWRRLLWVTLAALSVRMLLGSPLALAQDAPPDAAQPNAAPNAPLAAQSLSIYTRLDTQHQALRLLLATLKAEVPTLTLAAKDLTGLAHDLAQRAVVACLMAPVDIAETGDLIGAAVATTKVKGCLELLPLEMLNQLTKLQEEDLNKLRNVLETAGRVRIGLAILTPRIDALVKDSASAVLDLVEIRARATLDHELGNNLFTSDAQKASAIATFAQVNAALADSERKLSEIAADLAIFPIDALTISKQTLDALGATPSR